MHGRNAMDHVIVSRQGHAGRITLNRPDQLNALGWSKACRIAAATTVC
jgi:enoyl-CoA hydratase/carnithine racemase